MDRDKAIKMYNIIKEKYGLPELLNLEEELGFYFHDEDLPSAQLIRALFNRVLRLKSDIEGVLQPSNYCCLFETKFFNDEERKELFEKYQELMRVFWSLSKTMYGDDKLRIEEFKKGFEFWKGIKKFGAWLTERMIVEWAKKDEEIKNEGYIR